MKKSFLPYLAFGALCLIYGTSYAVSIFGLRIYPGPVFSALRMLFGFCASAISLFLQIVIDRKVSIRLKKSISKKETPIILSISSGIICLGLPHSLISIAQRSISSTTVQLCQPLIAFFALLFASFLLPDEPFSFSKFWSQVIAIFGSVLTTIPSFTQDSSNLLDFVLLLLALLSFAFGSVFVKVYCSLAEPSLFSFLQLFGATLYTIIFAIIKNGTSDFVLSWDLKWPFLLGVFYTYSSSVLSFYVLNSLGAVKSNYVNMGQIVVGVLVGVFAFGDWNNYSSKSIIISCIGLIFLSFSIYFGMKANSREKDSDFLPLLD